MTTTGYLEETILDYSSGTIDTITAILFAKP